MEKLELSPFTLKVKEAGWSSLSVALRMPKTWEVGKINPTEIITSYLICCKVNKTHVKLPFWYDSQIPGRIVTLRYAKVSFVVVSNTKRSPQPSWVNMGECDYRASDVALAQVHLVHRQLRFVIVDVLHRNIDFHKRLQPYKNTAGHH